MTAPKIKQLAENGGMPTGNYPKSLLVPYIRLDAPELVALVDIAKAFGFMDAEYDDLDDGLGVIVSHQGTGELLNLMSVRDFRKLRTALSAFEELTK